ncbi:MAG: GNAT family N-acetyltransferase [Spirochaetales bacterium]|jgi:GNAT superfamily N-acetyltransferase|nr:GNAT family N-acetyltransferase [Spirochaetales bacterium]
MKYTISYQKTIDIADLRVIQDGYDRYTASQIGDEGRQETAFFLRDENDLVVGGIKGSYTNYGWLWIDLLFVSESVRGIGYGSKLIRHIEDEARNNGCKYAYLNSFSFQAVNFYKKQGYKVFGELSDFPEGHSVCCMSKSLIENNSQIAE